MMILPHDGRDTSNRQSVRIAKNLIMFPLEGTIIVIVISAALPILTKLKLIHRDLCFVDKPSTKKLVVEIAFFTALSVAIVLAYIFFLHDFIADLGIKLL